MSSSLDFCQQDPQQYNSKHSSTTSELSLPDKIDTKKVIEMIKNADLYDLINISLKAKEQPSNESVKEFIQKALEKKNNQPLQKVQKEREEDEECDEKSTSLMLLREEPNISELQNRQVNIQQQQVHHHHHQDLIICTPPTKNTQKQGLISSPTTTNKPHQTETNDENSLIFTNEKREDEFAIGITTTTTLGKAYLKEEYEQENYQKHHSLHHYHQLSGGSLNNVQPLQPSILENQQNNCILGGGEGEIYIENLLKNNPTSYTQKCDISVIIRNEEQDSLELVGEHCQQRYEAPKPEEQPQMPDQFSRTINQSQIFENNVIGVGCMNQNSTILDNNPYEEQNSSLHQIQFNNCSILSMQSQVSQQENLNKIAAPAKFKPVLLSTVREAVGGDQNYSSSQATSTNKRMSSTGRNSNKSKQQSQKQFLQSQHSSNGVTAIGGRKSPIENINTSSNNINNVNSVYCSQKGEKHSEKAYSKYFQSKQSQNSPTGLQLEGNFFKAKTDQIQKQKQQLSQYLQDTHDQKEQSNNNLGRSISTAALKQICSNNLKSNRGRNHSGSRNHVFLTQTGKTQNNTTSSFYEKGSNSSPFIGQEQFCCKTPDQISNTSDHHKGGKSSNIGGQNSYIMMGNDHDNNNNQNNNQVLSLTQREQERKSALVMANILIKKGATDAKKQNLIKSFSEMNVGIFIELERVKKPSSIAFLATKMFCILANAFKEKPLEEEFDNWSKIQQYLSNQVTKYMSEILCNIKHKILMDLNSSQQQKEQLQNRLKKLKEEFFQGEGLKKFKHLEANKSLKAVVNFVFNVVAFVLEEGGGERANNKHHQQHHQQLVNLEQLCVQEQKKDELNAQTSYQENYNNIQKKQQQLQQFGLGQTNNSNMDNNQKQILSNIKCQTSRGENLQNQRKNASRRVVEDTSPNLANKHRSRNGRSKGGQSSDQTTSKTTQNDKSSKEQKNQLQRSFIGQPSTSSNNGIPIYQKRDHSNISKVNQSGLNKSTIEAVTTAIGDQSFSYKLGQQYMEETNNNTTIKPSPFRVLNKELSNGSFFQQEKERKSKLALKRKQSGAGVGGGGQLNSSRSPFKHYKKAKQGQQKQLQQQQYSNLNKTKMNISKQQIDYVKEQQSQFQLTNYNSDELNNAICKQPIFSSNKESEDGGGCLNCKEILTDLNYQNSQAQLNKERSKRSLRREREEDEEGELEETQMNNVPDFGKESQMHNDEEEVYDDLEQEQVNYRDAEDCYQQSSSPLASNKIIYNDMEEEDEEDRRNLFQREVNLDQPTSLQYLIREKAAEIEENMRLVSPFTQRKIDMSLIEQLKQRRKESSRLRGKELDQVIDKAITSIQFQILNPKSQIDGEDEKQDLFNKN